MTEVPEIPDCRWCGKEVEDKAEPSMGGPQPPRWVHHPGGYSICFPQQQGSPRAEPAVTVQSTRWELRIIVTAPTSADAERWTSGIREMVMAEFGDSMKLDISVGPSMTPDGLPVLPPSAQHPVGPRRPQ